MNTTQTLREWLLSTRTRLMAVATECDVAVTTVSRWASGQQLADADMVERIERFTGGAVTAADMHAVRLAWLKANRPEKFAGAETLPPPSRPATEEGVEEGCQTAEAAE